MMFQKFLLLLAMALDRDVFCVFAFTSVLFYWFFTRKADNCCTLFGLTKMKATNNTKLFCRTQTQTNHNVDKWQHLLWSKWIYSIVICYIFHVCRSNNECGRKTRAESENTVNNFKWVCSVLSGSFAMKMKKVLIMNICDSFAIC